MCKIWAWTRFSVRFRDRSRAQVRATLISSVYVRFIVIVWL